MRFGARELIFFSLLIGVLAAAGMGLSKINDHCNQRNMEIRQKQSALENLRQATAGVDDFNRKLEDLQKAITFFASKLPQEKEVDKILKEVWQMAEANALQCKTIKTLKTEKNPNYSEQPIELDLSGNFDGYYSFLLQLEKLSRITRTTEMHLEKISGKDGEMTAKMTLSIFFEPEAGATATASAQ